MAAETFELRPLEETDNGEPKNMDQRLDAEHARDNIDLLSRLGAEAVAADKVPPVMEWGYGHSKRTAGLS